MPSSSSPAMPMSIPMPAPARQALARLGFVLLFPGFFLYQTLIGLGLIGAYLGGYFSIVSLALLPPLLLLSGRELVRERFTVCRSDLVIALFLAYFAAQVGINAWAGADSTITTTHTLSILYMVNAYLIYKGAGMERGAWLAINLLALLLMSGIIFYFSVDGAFYLSDLGASRNPESVATYQGFARSYLLTLAAVVLFLRQAALRLPLYALAAAALYLNGSRSELVAMLLLVPITELHYARNKLAGAALIAAALAGIAAHGAQLLDVLPDSRVLELADLANSSSSNVRHELSAQALSTIVAHPWLGDYGSYPPGDYAHNMLSAWVDLGLLGFCYLLLMLAWPLLRLLQASVRARQSPDHLYALALLCMTGLLLVTAKTFDDMMIGAALGAYARYRCIGQTGATP